MGDIVAPTINERKHIVTEANSKECERISRHARITVRVSEPGMAPS
jgi:hypothetical protein